MNTPNAIQTALAHQKAGQFSEAQAICHKVLEQEPDHPDALNLMGVLAGQTGDQDAAIGYLTRAVNVRPTSAETHNNLAVALGNAKRADEAIAAFRRAIELKADYPAALLNLGRMLRQKGCLDEAIAAFNRVAGIEAGNFFAHFEAGLLLIQIRRFEQAAIALGRAVQIDGHSFEAHENLGYCLLQIGRADQAIVSCSRALEIAPDRAVAHNNLGSALAASARMDDAIASFERAVELQPDFTAAMVNLGAALASVGRLDEAIAAYRRAIAVQPENAAAHSNLVYALNFHQHYDAKRIFDESRMFAAVHEKPLASRIKPHANDRNLDRPLRIGYVSPDFRENVVGWNLFPLLQNHNHDAFKVVCFSDVVRTDGMTERLRGCADEWHDVSGMGDEQVAELVRRQKIDILVDLTLHMAGNRLLTFARKPAPVQVTYLGYCGTTGLSAIDYRFSDPYMDPLETDLSLYSEQTVCLPRSYWCYSPPASLESSAGPGPTAGHITFGCLNNFSKVSPSALGLWIEILRQTPGSHLILHADPGQHRQRIVDRMSAAGIAPQRLEFVGTVSRDQYMSTFNRIDISLDPFPHGGGITTCDSLWMGVPVVTLNGGIAVGRGGASILSNIGLPQFIAHSVVEYKRIAVELAGDLPARMKLRKVLRSRMWDSPLMDAWQFARDVENAYRQMWKNWCLRQR